MEWMTKLKKINVHSVILGVCGVALVMSSACASSHKQASEKISNANFFENAELFTRDFKSISGAKIKSFKDADKTGEKPIFPFQYHWLKSGRGTVLVVRNFSEGKPNIEDDEEYLKVTIWLKDLKEGNFSLGRDDALALVSKGSSVWPKATCLDSAPKGSINISKVTREEVIGTLEIHSSCIQPVSSQTVPVDLKEEFKFKVTTLDQLNPWIGKPGANAYDEIKPPK